MKFTLLTVTTSLAAAALGAQYGLDVQMHEVSRRALGAHNHKRHADSARALYERTQAELAGAARSGPRRMQKRCARRTEPSASSSAAGAASTNEAVAASAKPAAPSSDVKKNPPASSSASSSSSAAAAPSGAPAANGGHTFTFTNKCGNAVQPVFADTSCGYSPRCSDAGKFTGAQPASIAPQGTSTAVAPKNWVGRVFAKAPQCGAKGEDCTMLEFNLDNGSQYTPNAYDISNIQGFTQSISLQADGGELVTCTSANCSPKDAYAKGDMAGNAQGGPIDQAVRAAGAGGVGFHVTFCP